MNKVLLIGAGKIGKSIAKLLISSGSYDVMILDSNQSALTSLEQEIRDSQWFCRDMAFNFFTCKIQPNDDLSSFMKSVKAVISACSFDANKKIAKECAVAGVSYFDLTEDVSTTNFIRQLADDAADGQIFMPQCGLAPGFIGITAAHLIKKFDKVDSVKMRVGALPVYPSNALKYNLTWSTDGLVNEYCNFCDAINDGQKVLLPALDGLEEFMVDGVLYEAFNTSGGLGTLCDTMDGKVKYMDYKTARYPGHRELMDFLINGLRFRERRSELKNLFDNVLPSTKQDVVLVFCTATGYQNGKFNQITESRKIYGKEIFLQDQSDGHWSAIQITTAAGICAVVDLFFAGNLPLKGFVRQEDINFCDFILNRFGQFYLT